MTYKEAFDKITEAYIRGEIMPFNSKFCFCGTLCDNSSNWFHTPYVVHYDYNGYKGSDFVRMETALLRTVLINECDYGNLHYERVLFSGMCAALEVLKQIHIERGEDVDQSLTFVKREVAHESL